MENYFRSRVFDARFLLVNGNAIDKKHLLRNHSYPFVSCMANINYVVFALILVHTSLCSGVQIGKTSNNSPILARKRKCSFSDVIQHCNRKDDDCDGIVDEEFNDGIDNDRDGLIDEDICNRPASTPWGRGATGSESKLETSRQDIATRDDYKNSNNGMNYSVAIGVVACVGLIGGVIGGLYYKQVNKRKCKVGDTLMLSRSSFDGIESQRSVTHSLHPHESEVLNNSGQQGVSQAPRFKKEPEAPLGRVKQVILSQLQQNGRSLQKGLTGTQRDSHVYAELKKKSIGGCAEVSIKDVAKETSATTKGGYENFVEINGKYPDSNRGHTPKNDRLISEQGIVSCESRNDEGQSVALPEFESTLNKTAPENIVEDHVADGNHSDGALLDTWGITGVDDKRSESTHTRGGEAGWQSEDLFAETESESCDESIAEEKRGEVTPGKRMSSSKLRESRRKSQKRKVKINRTERSKKCLQKKLRNAMKLESKGDIELLLSQCNEHNDDHPEAKINSELITRATKTLDYLKSMEALHQASDSCDLAAVSDAMNNVDMSQTIKKRRMTIELKQCSKLKATLERSEHYKSCILEMDRSTLAEIKQYTHPPPAIHHVMVSTLLILGEDEAKTEKWSECQKMCNATGPGQNVSEGEVLFNRLMRIEKHHLHPEVAARVREILSNHSPTEVSTISRGAGTLFHWANELTKACLEEYGGQTIKPASVRRQREIFSAKNRKPSGQSNWK